MEFEQRKSRRLEKNKFQADIWVEALKKSRKEYRICQITRIAKKDKVFDLKYEDGNLETGIRLTKSERFAKYPRIRITNTGNRTFEVDQVLHGKETYDSNRDNYHVFEVQQHQKRVKEMHADSDAIRRKLKTRSVKACFVCILCVFVHFWVMTPRKIYRFKYTLNK